MIKVLITDRGYSLWHPIGISHHGVHLKRSLGGPPWWRYINGIWIITKTSIYWITFRKHDWVDRGKFITDRRRGRVVGWKQ